MSAAPRRECAPKGERQEVRESPLVETRCCHVLVVGGGPAGASLARWLGQRGRHVVLVDAGTPPRGLPAETILPEATFLLHRLGLESVLLEAGFRGLPRHGVVWGAEYPEWRDPGPLGPGFKVERGRFDRILLDLAARAGAEIIVGRAMISGHDGRSPVRIQSADGPDIEIDAGVIVIANGRSQAPHECSGPETIVFHQVVNGNLGPKDATFIEAVSVGWWWWMPLRSGAACLALFADAAEVRSRGRQAVLEDAGKESSNVIRDFSLCAPRATAFRARCVCSRQDRFIRIGDAASVIDPLSSQGIEKALASAEEAGYVVNTILERPGEAPVLMEHQRRWEERLHALHMRRTASVYGRVLRFRGHPFYQGRAGDREDPPYQSLPARLRPAPDLQPCRTYERRGFMLESRSAWRCGEDGDPLHLIGAAPVAAILEAVGEEADREQILSRAARDHRLFLLSPEHVTKSLLALLNAGWLHAC